MANNDKTNVEVGVNAGEENRGREETRQPPKYRGKSKSKETRGLEPRVVEVETSMKAWRGELDDVLQQLEELREESEEVRDGAKLALNMIDGDLRREIQGLREWITMEFRDSVMQGVREHLMKEVHETLAGGLATLQGKMDKELSILQARVEDMRGDLALCKMAVASGVGASTTTSRIEIPKPSPFVGKREARAVDNFIWEMEQYLEGVHIVDEASKIKTATMYLKDTAALWWRRRHVDVERGTCTINTWVDFIREFKRQFYPVNAKNEAKSRLRNLKHDGTIQEYVKEFTTLTLEVGDLSDEDALFFFLDGLQPWAMTELSRRGVQSLAVAIAEAEALVDLSKRKSSEPKKEESDDEKGGGEKHGQVRNEGSRKPPRSREKTPPLRRGCFICEGPHLARECPKKASLQAMRAETEEEPHEEMHVGSMQFFNAINVRKETPKVGAKGNTKTGESKVGAKGLAFVNAKVKGIPVRALVDTGATHNFVSVDEAKRLGLETIKEGGMIKAVNGDAKPITGMARGVNAKIGDWEGELDLSVVPMDDFHLVLGMDFFDKVQAFPMSFSNTLCILDGGRACMVTMERGTKGGTKTMSAMQLGEDFNGLKSNPGERPGGAEVPNKDREVLEECKDPRTGDLPERRSRTGKKRTRRRRRAPKQEGPGGIEMPNDTDEVLEECKDVGMEDQPKRMSRKGRRPRRRARRTKDEPTTEASREQDGSSVPVEAKRGPDRVVPRGRHDEDVVNLGGGECHVLPNSRRDSEVRPEILEPSTQVKSIQEYSREFKTSQEEGGSFLKDLHGGRGLSV